MTPDEQEAGSVKYNICRIVRLSSGNFALFNPFINGKGLEQVIIGPLSKIYPHILTVEQCHEYCKQISISEGLMDEDGEWINRKPTAADKAGGLRLLEALGRLKPTEPFKRRV